GAPVVPDRGGAERPLGAAIADGRLPAVLVQQDRQPEHRSHPGEQRNDGPPDPRPHLALRLAHDRRVGERPHHTVPATTPTGYRRKGEQMKLLALAGAALLVIGLGGCSAPADENTEPDAPNQSATTPPESTQPDVPADDAPCGGLTTEDLVGIFGVELEGPEPSTGDSDQNGITWKSTGCDWENDPIELEIDLDISQASDFPDGKLTCMRPGGVGDVTPVSGIGTQAWWKFADFNEVEGELRVCTDDRMLELAVDAPTGSMTSDELKEKVTTAMRVV